MNWRDGTYTSRHHAALHLKGWNVYTSRRRDTCTPSSQQARETHKICVVFLLVPCSVRDDWSNNQKNYWFRLRSRRHWELNCHMNLGPFLAFYESLRREPITVCIEILPCMYIWEVLMNPQGMVYIAQADSFGFSLNLLLKFYQGFGLRNHWSITCPSSSQKLCWN